MSDAESLCMELRTRTRAIQVSTYDHSTASVFVFVLCFSYFMGPIILFLDMCARAVDVGRMPARRIKYPL